LNNQNCSCTDSTNNDPEKAACCCQSASVPPTGKYLTPVDEKLPWLEGDIVTPLGLVPRVGTKLGSQDILGAWKVRWGIGRMNYKISPGLYGVGQPHQDSPVLVSCNYKLSFDTLRKNLTGVDAWILVIDTNGVNVWCAAGKGTFGTKELVSRLKKTRLGEIVSHHKIILPQLGAPGIKAQEVFRTSGFRVVYGPVQAKDLKAFLVADMKATPPMRIVPFTMMDRLVLTPIELVGAIKPSLMIFGVLFLLNFVIPKPFGLVDVGAFLGSVLTGCVLTPALLPLIPGKAFALKGWLLGLLGTLGLLAGFYDTINTGLPMVGMLGYLLTFPAIAAYYAMNFTGSSTFTSFSGVQKEMRLAVPVLLFLSCGGALLLLISHFG